MMNDYTAAGARCALEKSALLERAFGGYGSVLEAGLSFIPGVGNVSVPLFGLADAGIEAAKGNWGAAAGHTATAGLGALLGGYGKGVSTLLSGKFGQGMLNKVSPRAAGFASRTADWAAQNPWKATGLNVAGSMGAGMGASALFSPPPAGNSPDLSAAQPPMPTGMSQPTIPGVQLQPIDYNYSYKNRYGS